MRDYASGLQTMRWLMMVYPLWQAVESPSRAVVSRTDRFPAGWGAVEESAQATPEMIIAAPSKEKTRFLGDMERSVRVKRSIYLTSC
jgi:hypothetical protein